MSLRREQFLGAWRLVHWRVTYPDGRITFPYGERAEGLLLYTAERMSATVAASGRASLQSANPRHAPVADRAAAFDGFFHYSGRWQIDGEAVLHELEIALNPDMVGTVQRRDAVFDDDGLTLSAAEPLPEGGFRRHELSWVLIGNESAAPHQGPAPA